MTPDEIIREPAIITVRDVYGDLYRIDALQLYLSDRVQLTLYTNNGRKLYDFNERMNWRNRCTSIHRENIAEVL